MPTNSNAEIVPVPTWPNSPSFGGRLGDFGDLTLANGMTAGYGVNDGHTSNPSLPVGGPYGVNAFGDFSTTQWPVNRIGVMRNVPGSIPAPANITPGSAGTDYFFYSLYFLYNPNQIQVNFTANTSMVPPAYLYGTGATAANFKNAADTASSSVSGLSTSPGNTTVPALIQNQTVSWSLLFDRTYDMVYNNPNGDNRGVLQDVAALYNIMGTFQTDAAVPFSTPVQVVFGQNAAGQIWGFTGYVTGFNITYGIFRHDMIPSRCEVDLSMMLTYIAPSVPPQASVAPQPGTTFGTSSPISAQASVLQNQAQQAANSQLGGGTVSNITTNGNPPNAPSPSHNTNP